MNYKRKTQFAINKDGNYFYKQSNFIITSQKINVYIKI